MVTITEGEVQRAHRISQLIPELHPAYTWSKWAQRLRNRQVVALVAEIEGKAVGFKVGYHEDRVFYSWVGGVIPESRRKGVAHLLATRMEEIAAEQGAQMMRMKTRNRFREMLLFAISNGFHIVDVQQKGDSVDDWRIVLEKKI